RHGEREASPRVSDLDALAASTMGKVEIETLEEGRDEQIADRLVRSAGLTVFKRRGPPGALRGGGAGVGGGGCGTSSRRAARGRWCPRVTTSCRPPRPAWSRTSGPSGRRSGS